MVKKILLSILLLGIFTQQIHAVFPPTKDQVHKYKQDGTYASRKEKAIAFKNHIMSPLLSKKLPIVGPTTRVLPSGIHNVMPSTGNVNILVLMIDFSDYPHEKSFDEMKDAIAGNASNSFKSFYHTSSYGKLNIDSTVLGWYRSKKSRANIEQTMSGREALIKEALTHYNNEGHDFTQYDNDHDGYVDYLAVFWTGPDNGWANFWWGYSTRFSSTIKLDGVQFSNYTWQWESTNMSTLKHETGHAMGLPDLYDYSNDSGPDGGLGGFGMMAGAWGDFNPYFKWLLDWSTPKIMAYGENNINLKPMALNDKDSSLVIWPNASIDKPHSEFFMIANKSKVGLDQNNHTNGLVIYHVDASLNASNTWQYNNQYTSHKLLRIMEADGLEEIEQGYSADEGDYYTNGDSFTPSSSPDSKAYDGSTTGISISHIQVDSNSKNISFNAGIAGTLAEIYSPQNGVVLSQRTTIKWNRNQAAYTYMLIRDTKDNKYLFSGYVYNSEKTLELSPNGHNIEISLWSYIAGKWSSKYYNYVAPTVSITLYNSKSKRYLFDPGSVVTKAENGWLSSKAMIGTDINYYDRATWNLIPQGKYYLLKNNITKRYLFSPGSVVTKYEGGWLKSPSIVGTDDTYYDRALWEIIKRGDGKYYLKNKETHRLLFQTGVAVKGNEYGWSKSPKVLGTDIDYYGKAQWIIHGNGLSLLK